MRRALAVALLASTAALSMPAKATTIIDTTTAPVAIGWHAFGSPDTATYGEVFSVATPDTFLNDFSLYLLNDGSGTLNFKAYVGAWDGSKATSILYASTTQSITGDGSFSDTGFSFSPNIALTAGDYVAFLSTSALGTQPAVTFGMPLGLPSGGPGFVFTNSGTNFAALIANAWDCPNCGTTANVWFKATLTSVPEPMAVLVLGSGLLGLGFARRRPA